MRGPHRFDTTVPSVLWNRVIRARGDNEYLCTTCIVRAFARAGVSFTAVLYGDDFPGGLPIAVEINGALAVAAYELGEQNNTLRAALDELRQLATRDSCTRRRVPGARYFGWHRLPMTSGPSVAFPENPFCQRHFHQVVGPEHEEGPHALTWQSRYAVAVIEVAQAVIADQRILRRAGWNPETGSLGDASTLTVLLAESVPLCCFLGDGTFNELVVVIHALHAKTRLGMSKTLP